MTALEFRSICLVCGERFAGNNFHVNRVNHGMHIIKHMTTKKYIIKFLFDGVHPLCKCGCGKETSKIKSFPYFREYISGHNKSTLNFKFSESSKEKMKKSAFKRMKMQKKVLGCLPIHSKNAIQSRTLSYSNHFMDMKSKKYNVTITSTIDERRSGLYSYKCNVCNNEYKQYFGRYFLCPVCHPQIRSKAQNEIFDFIHNTLGVECIQNTKKILTNLELDFYIPSNNIAIEYNGLYWHSENGGGKDKTYHITKTKLCKDAGIRLIHIFEDEWVNKQDIVKSKLQHILQKDTAEKVYARKCILQEISTTEKNEFLEKNHLQGKDNSSVCIGAFYNSELVSVMTFGHLRKALGQKNVNPNEYEMIRFASRIDKNVIGSSSKILKFFISKYAPSKIISYCDNRWSAGNLYQKIGFTLTSFGIPNYWYTTYKFDRAHRFNFIKQKLVKMGYDKNQTEWQIMQSLGYDRIWDCGSAKYEMIM